MKQRWFGKSNNRYCKLNDHYCRFIAVIAILGVTSASNIDLLAGKWENELGSTMCIYWQTEPSGQLNGWYNSPVGQSENQYDLAGRYDTESINGGTLGW